jgi:SAM-dependent methyltransferase
MVSALQIVDIACGYGFTSFAANTRENAKVFGCGINTDSQIGEFSGQKAYLSQDGTLLKYCPVMFL